MTWNAEQYLRFGGPRLRPVMDLIGAIGLGSPERVVDLGCGPGNATILLRERWPQCELTGVDNDAAMLAKARRDYPAETWVDADIAEWARTAATCVADLLFTNAALQWLPDHEILFPALLRQVRSGGVFACQMPRNFMAPSHTLLRETMHDPRWLDRLRAFANWDPVSRPQDYYEWMKPHAAAVDIWETEYLQALEGENAVLEWVKGTSLVPVREALEPDEYADFTDRYRALLRDAYPRRPDGITLLPFRRLFMVIQVK